MQKNSRKTACKVFPYRLKVITKIVYFAFFFGFITSIPIAIITANTIR